MRRWYFFLIVAILAACQPSPVSRLPIGWSSRNLNNAYIKILSAPQGKLWFVQDVTGKVDIFDPSSGAWSQESTGSLIPLGWDKDGNLWSGSTDGLYIQRNGKQEHFTTDQGLPNNKITTAFFTKKGGPSGEKAWIGTIRGMVGFDGQKTTQTFLRTKGQLAGDSVTFITEVADGSLWVGTDLGVAHLTGDNKWERYNAPFLFSEDMKKATGLSELPDGVLWLATYGDGAYRLEKGQWKQYLPEDTNNMLASENLTSVAASKGDVYFGTDGNGLTKFDGKNWTHYGTGDGLSSDTIRDLYIDKTGVVWVATSAGISSYVP